jgi:hypothetical protein
MTADRPDELMLRVRAADPALALQGAPAPPLERVTAARRRRASRGVARLGGAGVALALAATLALAVPSSDRSDVVARAAAALSGPDVLHTVSVARTADGKPAGRAESWRAPDGRYRSLIYSAGGELVGEVALRGDESLSWSAQGNVIYRTRNTALDGDPFALLRKAGAGQASVTRRDDTTVRGVPVHVVALTPTVAGEDTAPERVYYIDTETYLPVRIEFGDTVTDMLEADTIPLERAKRQLSMSAHPGATRHDLRPGG